MLICYAQVLLFLFWVLEIMIEDVPFMQIKDQCCLNFHKKTCIF